MKSWPAPTLPTLPGRGPRVLVRDTASGVLVDPVSGDEATLYVCGITPYDATHLGHAATAVAFDLLGRAWRDAGLSVRYASNVTDVDDPLLERASATGVDWRELAADQTALYGRDMTALRVIPPQDYRGVVETVPRVAEAVAELVRLGAAYEVPTPDAVGGGPGDVYADLSVDPRFGEVAHLDEATMLALSAQRGGDPDRPGKRGRLDPLLWRRERAGEPAWDGGPLGRGRPGWHIECVVIARDALGLPFSVQGGGTDLAFPHHEMSCSHARVLSGGYGALAHVHAGMVGLDGEKMSKSLGNLVLVHRLLDDGVDPMVVRLAALAHHYARDWAWSGDVLRAAQDRLARWREATAVPGAAAAEPVLAGVRAALADDLDAPRALGVVDAWAAATLAGAGESVDAAGLVGRVVDALLGVRL